MPRGQAPGDGSDAHLTLQHPVGVVEHRLHRVCGVGGCDLIRDKVRSVLRAVPLTSLPTMMDNSTAGRKDFHLEDLRRAISAFVQERDWEQFHSPKNLAMALSVEVAEIVEHFQWLTEEQSQNLSPEKLAEVREEIGDVMIYLTELADMLGIDPVEAARAKVVINGQKYPAELVKGKAVKYTEY